MCLLWGQRREASPGEKGDVEGEPQPQPRRTSLFGLS